MREEVVSASFILQINDQFFALDVKAQWLTLVNFHTYKSSSPLKKD